MNNTNGGQIDLMVNNHLSNNWLSLDNHAELEELTDRERIAHYNK